MLPRIQTKYSGRDSPPYTAMEYDFPPLGQSHHNTAGVPSHWLSGGTFPPDTAGVTSH